MNWNDFEALVRSSVDDELETEGDYTDASWSLADEVNFTNLALSNFSRHFPLEKIHEVTVTTGTKSYDLPSDIITPPHKSIADARWQRSSARAEHLVITRWRPGSTETLLPAGSNMGAFIWGSKIILEKEPTSADAQYPIELYYYGQHTSVPADPSSYEFTVMDADMECIFWYVTSLMMMKLDAGDALLRQYADSDDLGSSRDDSPPRRSAMYRMRQYENCVKERLAHRDSPRIKRVRR